MNSILKKGSQDFEDINKRLLDQSKALYDKEYNIFGESSDTIGPVYSLVFEPDDRSKGIISTIIADMVAVQSDLYYYGVDQVHMTLIGGMTLNCNIDDIADTVRALFTERPRIRMYGINGNPASANIIGYPENFDYSNLRNVLREAVGEDGAKYNDWVERIGWINYVRYSNYLQDDLIDYLVKHYADDYCVMVPDKVKVVENSTKSMTKSTTRIIEEIRLV